MLCQALDLKFKDELGGVSVQRQNNKSVEFT